MKISRNSWINKQSIEYLLFSLPLVQQFPIIFGYFLVYSDISLLVLTFLYHSFSIRIWFFAIDWFTSNNKAHWSKRKTFWALKHSHVSFETMLKHIFFDFSDREETLAQKNVFYSIGFCIRLISSFLIISTACAKKSVSHYQISIVMEIA